MQIVKTCGDSLGRCGAAAAHSLAEDAVHVIGDEFIFQLHPDLAGPGGRLLIHLHDEECVAV